LGRLADPDFISDEELWAVALSVAGGELMSLAPATHGVAGAENTAALRWILLRLDQFLKPGALTTWDLRVGFAT